MNDMSAPVGSGTPNPYGLFRIRGTKKIRVLILSETWCGVRSHYISRNSVVCSGADCEICLNQRITPRWRGYLMARTEFDGQPIVTLEFTERCYALFRDRLENYSTLRGHTVTLWRSSNSNSAPLHGTFQDYMIPAKSLPQPVDIVEQVAKFYRVKPEVVQCGVPVLPDEVSAAQALAEAKVALKLKKA